MESILQRINTSHLSFQRLQEPNIVYSNKDFKPQTGLISRKALVVQFYNFIS